MIYPFNFIFFYFVDKYIIKNILIVCLGIKLSNKSFFVSFSVFIKNVLSSMLPHKNSIIIHKNTMLDSIIKC